MMDFWEIWIYFKIIISILALIFCLLSGILVWRMRGILQWQRSLSTEMTVIEQEAQQAEKERKAALYVVLSQCQEIRKARSPDSERILKLNQYLKQISSCFYPDADNPELYLTIRQTLMAATMLVERLEGIIQRKGLRRFSWIRIKHIRKAFDWYGRIRKNKIWGWVLRHQGAVVRILHFQRFLLPDPFSWIAYLSNQLTILILTRTILLDIYIFVGRLAVDAYDPQFLPEEKSVDNENLAETLATLYDIEEDLSDWQNDPKINDIRIRLVGIPKKILSPPTYKEWRKSIIEVAEIIADRHFSQSPAPLEEAALGPIIVQSQSLLKSISDMGNYSGTKQFLSIRLTTIHSAHNFVGNASKWRMTDLVLRAWGGYRSVRWPFKIYRWIKRTSPSGIAMELGWETMRKTLINFLARFTFDRTCQELELLYQRSKKTRK